MNKGINIICYIILAVAIIYIIFPRKIEGFIDKRPRSNNRVQVGTLNNSPKEVQNLMMDLNKTGGQMKADTQYDTINEKYLDEE